MKSAGSDQDAGAGIGMEQAICMDARMARAPTGRIGEQHAAARPDALDAVQKDQMTAALKPRHG